MRVCDDRQLAALIDGAGFAEVCIAGDTETQIASAVRPRKPDLAAAA